MKQYADQIFTNGNIITVDERGSSAEAVAVSDGLIHAVGKTEDILKLRGNATQVVNLQGKTMVPGLIDSHSHFPLLGVKTLYQVDLGSPPLGGMKCIADITKILKEKAKTVPKGNLIIGMGYDDTLLLEKKHPTKDDLDQATTDHPVLIVHYTLHMGVANSPMLEVMQITKDTPNPSGGEIIKDASSGEPTGLLMENAFMKFYFNEIPALSLEEGVEAVYSAACQYAAQGLTTVQVCLLSEKDKSVLDHLIAARNCGKMPLRMILWAVPELIAGIRDGSIVVDGLETSGIEFKAVKLFVDGSMQLGTGYLTRPYHITPAGQSEGHRGAPIISREELTQKVKKLHKEGFQIAIHGNGDAAMDDILHAYSEAQKECPREDARHLIIHAQTLREDQLDIMKELGVMPSFFSAHVYYFGDRHAEIFIGPERAARLDPAKSAFDRGIKASIHTDTPVLPINLIHSMWTVVNRITYGGKVLGPEQKISPLDALKAITINPAYQIFDEKRRGSIEIGKVADFVILSGCPLGLPEKIKDISVLETIVGGKTVYKNPVTGEINS